MRYKNIFLGLLLSSLLLLSACGQKVIEKPEQPAGTQEQTATLYADFSNGNADPLPEQIVTSEMPYTGELTPELLTAGLSELTGLDFTAEITTDSAGIWVDWANESTLVAGLDDRDQKEGFQFSDADSLRWFMMDSLWRTLQENFGQDIYYTQGLGGYLVFEDLYPVKEFPNDIPYMGSAFYFAHSDNKGALSQQEAWDLLAERLNSQLQDGLSLMENLEDEINGEHCWTFILGENKPDQFVAREHFAVTDSGEIYVMDLNTSEYLPYPAE